MSRYYIKDFCEDLNYQGIALHIGESISLIRLRNKLELDKIGHLYRFEYMLETKNRLMYIENCDFQDVWDSTPEKCEGNVFNCLDECHAIFELYEDPHGFYIELPSFIKR